MERIRPLLQGIGKTQKFPLPTIHTGRTGLSDDDDEDDIYDDDDDDIYDDGDDAIYDDGDDVYDGDDKVQQRGGRQ